MFKVKVSARRIKLVDKANSHRLIIGKSGYGKTWCSYRMIEEAVEDGKQILILDYSGSYTLQELEKGKFEYMNYVESVTGGSMKWIYEGCDFYAAFQDAMLKALHLTSYRQKTLLKNVVQEFAVQGSDITIAAIIEKLETELACADNEKKKVVEAVLNRMSAYTEIDTVFAKQEDEEKVLVKPITIIQISEMETMEKCFLTELFSELFWKSVKGKHNWKGCIVYDEFQNISLETGSTLSEMLREGRKYGIGVWLASQFLSGHSTEEKDTLLQVSNIVLFHPTERDLKSAAMMLDYMSWKKWMKPLEKLDVGEAIIKGTVSVIGSEKVFDKPVLCTVEKTC